jgi:hypothetical protein
MALAKKHNTPYEMDIIKKFSDTLVKPFSLERLSELTDLLVGHPWLLFEEGAPIAIIASRRLIEKDPLTGNMDDIKSGINRRL